MRLSILTPTIRGSRCDALSRVVGDLRQHWDVTWWLCPNAPGWDARPPLFARVVPLVFSGPVPVLSRINQARELLRVAASSWPADVVVWLDDDMTPTTEQLHQLASTAIRSDTRGLLVSPVMRNRHSTDDYTCAWVFTQTAVEVRGADLDLSIPGLSFLPSSVSREDRGFVWAHGVGLGCVAHPWAFLLEFAFPAAEVADDEWLSRAFTASGRTGIIVDYTLDVGHIDADKEHSCPEV